jgi:hypothetical protein
MIAVNRHRVLAGTIFPLSRSEHPAVDINGSGIRCRRLPDPDREARAINRANRISTPSRIECRSRNVSKLSGSYRLDPVGELAPNGENALPALWVRRPAGYVTGAGPAQGSISRRACRF